MSDLEGRPRVTDEQLLQLRSWGASHRQIAAMLGLRRNTVSVRFSRIDRAKRARTADVDDGDGEHGGGAVSRWWWPVGDVFPPAPGPPGEVALARSVREVPRPGALPGGCVYEMKFDGWRGVLLVSGARAELWSRHGTDLSDRFADLVAAVRSQLMPGCMTGRSWCGGTAGVTGTRCCSAAAHRAG